MFRVNSIFALSYSLCTVFAAAKQQHNSGPTEIIRDVAIVGGGASGTYAAVRLREDFNKTVVVIEPRPNLGGHANTYNISGTNASIDFGVQSYNPNNAANGFFARFGIATETPMQRKLTPLNVDVETGEVLEDYSLPSVNTTNEAFQRWLAITSKYKDYLEPGYWNFPQSSDIPADFLTPFQEFVKRNRLEAAVPRILLISGVGYGGVREILTLTVLRAFGASLTKDLLTGSLFRPVGNNSILYKRALDLLQPDVLLSSTVQNTKQAADGIELSVKQGNTEYTVKARRVLFTAGPSLRNLAPFHLDDKSLAVFSDWREGGDFVGVMKAPCLPENSSITYMPKAAALNDPLALNDWPYSLRLDSTGPSGLGLYRVVFGANHSISVDDFKQLVAQSVENLQNAGTIEDKCETEFKAVSEHTRPWWPQSAERMRTGFVQDMYALQGYRNMWYTGYAWAAPYSSTVWAFTDTVLERLLADFTRQ
ncbi:FAD/NAD(P)-binding domain-containing protein [Stemphylium lycopersici]|uniref:FAD/NAD(P)-binding domain-containing protein n=1 Tax=Stemphylium lycopersici TaxID=183478 RepID=A0A364NE12_STELY|nr:FAD/NAD(P)-binding domain-containing protein [Stemphylium lycopersici]